MELDKAIKERKSVREYLTKRIPEEKLMEVLDAARYAPKAGNLQNFYFIVVKSKKRKEDISECCKNQSWMKNAPIHIVVCNKVKDIKRLYSEQGELFSIQNAAAAMENILLKATELGLGTCWVGALDFVKIQRILKLPDDVRVEAIITLGYPKKIPRTSRKYDLDKIVYFEEWDKKK